MKSKNNNPYADALNGLDLKDPVSAFFKFCKEREQIRIKREQGESFPWSEDTIFQKGRFLNVFREDDRVSKTIIMFADGLEQDLPDLVKALFFALLKFLVENFAPFLYREAVNALTSTGNAPFLLGAVGMTVAYGSARILSRGFEQLRDVVFAAVAQRAFRNLALETFQHIHKLSLRYHISRKTGALSRVIERGVKGLEFLLRFLLFSIGPLVLELLIIAGIMLFWFDYL